MRKITEQELKEILAKHKKWVEAAWIKEHKEGKAILEEADLRFTDLRFADLRFADLINTNLQGADLENAHLKRANLCGGNLVLTNLKGANLTKADLNGADLSGADLSGANLNGADLRRVDLRESNITQQQLSQAYTDSTTKHDFLTSTRAQKEIEIKDIEKQLKQKQEAEEELKKQIGELKQNSQETEKLEVELKELNTELEKEKEKAENLKEELEDEKKEKEITTKKIKSALDRLSSMLQYKELFGQKVLFYTYLFAALFFLLLIFHYKAAGLSDFITDVKKNTNLYFFLANISPVLLCLGLFGTFLTQANKTYRNIREILDKKEVVQKLQGALEAKIELAEQSQLAQASVEVNEIMSKFIEHHLFNSNNKKSKLNGKDSKDDEVNTLSIADLKKLIGKIK